jgi:hypothetical protein
LNEFFNILKEANNQVGSMKTRKLAKTDAEFKRQVDEQGKEITELKKSVDNSKKDL